MPDDVTNELIHSVLQRMQGPLSSRIAAVEVTVSGTHKRIDRIEHRLDRIETRLGLIEA